jgi:hypothetical protein
VDANFVNWSQVQVGVREERDQLLADGQRLGLKVGRPPLVQQFVQEASSIFVVIGQNNIVVNIILFRHHTLLAL